MKKVFHILLLILCTMVAYAQPGQKVQSRPYTDLRPFHFGVLLSAHFQDVEFNNVDTQHIIHEDDPMSETLITVDQDRWDAGLTVGVLDEFRLSTNFQFRIAPIMYLDNRHLTFHNFNKQGANGQPIEERQDIKTAYISTALDLIFAAPCFNNRRPHLTTGVNPMMNLNGSSDQYVASKRYETFAEVGVGCDFYLPHFKLRPELRFLFGLVNSCDARHTDGLKDKDVIPHAKSADRSRSKMIVLTFYSE